MDRSSEAYGFLKSRTGNEMDRPFWWRLYKQWIQQKAEGRPEFLSELRQTATQAIAGEDVNWVRKGIHAIAAVGQAADVQLLRPLLQHPDPHVARDARTAIFELTHKPQEKPLP